MKIQVGILSVFMMMSAQAFAAQELLGVVSIDVTKSKAAAEDVEVDVDSDTPHTKTPQRPKVQPPGQQPAQTAPPAPQRRTQVPSEPKQPTPPADRRRAQTPPEPSQPAPPAAAPGDQRRVQAPPPPAPPAAPAPPVDRRRKSAGPVDQPPVTGEFQAPRSRPHQRPHKRYFEDRDWTGFSCKIDYQARGKEAQFLVKLDELIGIESGLRGFGKITCSNGQTEVTRRFAMKICNYTIDAAIKFGDISILGKGIEVVGLRDQDPEGFFGIYHGIGADAAIKWGIGGNAMFRSDGDAPIDIAMEGHIIDGFGLGLGHSRLEIFPMEEAEADPRTLSCRNTNPRWWDGINQYKPDSAGRQRQQKVQQSQPDWARDAFRGQ